jgi:peptidoglycan/xylan/chitin deacetylase (PgdA/CDA1 family)
MVDLSYRNLLQQLNEWNPVPGAKGRALRLSAPGPRVLLYHRVVPEVRNDLFRMQVSCKHFEQHLAWLAEHYSVVSLDTLARQIRRGDLPDRQVVITFDDGYVDNRRYAAELLRRYRLPATFFLTAGWIGAGRRFWWDEVASRIEASLPGAHREPSDTALADTVWTVCSELRPLSARERAWRMARLGAGPPAPEAADLPMTWNDARELVRLGFSIGAHSLTHPAISGLDEAEARHEIAGSRRVLEERLGMPIRHFCYPYDEVMRWGRRVPRLGSRLVAEAGYETASTVLAGPVTAQVNPLSLPRLAVQDWSLDRFITALSTGLAC